MEQFYKLPKFLFNDEYSGLSAEAKVIYSIMLDREKLSENNKDKYSDECGVYIIMTVEQIQVFLNCSRPKAVKVLKELKEFNLINKKKEVKGKQQ